MLYIYYNAGIGRRIICSIHHHNHHLKKRGVLSFELMNYLTNRMNIKTTIIALLLFAQSIGFGQKMKSISEISYASTFISGDPDDSLKTYPEHFNLYFQKNITTRYDQYENVLRKTKIDEDERITSNTHISYIDSIRISRINYTYPFDTIANYSITYQYNSQFQLIQEITIDSEGVVVDSIFYSQPSTIETRFYRYGKLVRRMVNYYDSINNAGEIYNYGNQDSLLFIRCNYLDKDQQLTKSSYCDIFKRPLITDSFKYDNTGHTCYNKREYHSTNEIEETSTTHDTIENASTHKRFINGELAFSSKTFYDIYKNKILTEFYDDLGEISFTKSYNYKFDANYNWIKKMEYEKEELLSVTYRSIEYFK